MVIGLRIRSGLCFVGRWIGWGSCLGCRLRGRVRRLVEGRGRCGIRIAAGGGVWVREVRRERTCFFFGEVLR